MNDELIQLRDTVTTQAARIAELEHQVKAEEDRAERYRIECHVPSGHVLCPDGVMRKVNGRLVVNQSNEVVGHNAVIWMASKRLLNGQAGCIRNECEWLFKSHSNRQDAITEAVIKLDAECSMQEALTAMSKQVKP
jgi:hypothetical protein